MTMTRKVLGAVMGAVVLVASVAGGAAAQDDDRNIIEGPAKTTFGALDLVLGQGASAEVAYQPDQSRLSLTTLTGEARVVTSARHLLMVENKQGRVEAILPSGRVVPIEAGRTDIVERDVADDSGTITIRLFGTGPLAQAGPPPGVIRSSAVITVLTSGPAAAIVPITDDSVNSARPQSLSPSQ